MNPEGRAHPPRQPLPCECPQRPPGVLEAQPVGGAQGPAFPQPPPAMPLPGGPQGLKAGPSLWVARLPHPIPIQGLGNHRLGAFLPTQVLGNLRTKSPWPVGLALRTSFQERYLPPPPIHQDLCPRTELLQQPRRLLPLVASRPGKLQAAPATPRTAQPPCAQLPGA